VNPVSRREGDATIIIIIIFIIIIIYLFIYLFIYSIREYKIMEQYSKARIALTAAV